MFPDPEAFPGAEAGQEVGGEVYPETEETDPGLGADPEGGLDLGPGLGLDPDPEEEEEATGQEVDHPEEADLLMSSDYMLEVAYKKCLCSLTI